MRVNAVRDTWDRHRLIEQISSSSSSSSSSGDVVKPECVDAAECAIQPDLRCGKVERVNGKCEITIAIGAIASQVCGDGHREDCDVKGQVVDVDDPSDIYNDGKPCSFDICEQGKVANKAFPDGFGCPETGSGVCFESACVDGVDGTTACGNGQVCAYTTCVPMYCDDFVFQPALGETDFDCGGPCRPCSALGNCSGDQDCADGVRNGEETGDRFGGLQAVRDALWAKGARLVAIVRAGCVGRACGRRRRAMMG